MFSTLSQNQKRIGIKLLLKFVIYVFENILFIFYQNECRINKLISNKNSLKRGKFSRTLVLSSFYLNVTYTTYSHTVKLCVTVTTSHTKTLQCFYFHPKDVLSYGAFWYRRSRRLLKCSCHVLSLMIIGIYTFLTSNIGLLIKINVAKIQDVKIQQNILYLAKININKEL